VFLERLGGRAAISPRDEERKAVREDPRRRPKREGSGGERFPVDLEAAKPPGGVLKCAELKGDELLEISILQLQVLRVQEDALGPQHFLQSPHRQLRKVRETGGRRGNPGSEAPGSGAPAALVRIRDRAHPARSKFP